MSWTILTLTHQHIQEYFQWICLDVLSIQMLFVVISYPISDDINRRWLHLNH